MGCCNIKKDNPSQQPYVNIEPHITPTVKESKTDFQSFFRHKSELPTKCTSFNLIVKPCLKEDNSKEENKENRESEEKCANENAPRLSLESSEIIPFPLLKLNICNSRNLSYIYDRIKITPNSLSTLNGLQCIKDRFVFGKVNPNKGNDYSINDDSLAIKQFEIFYKDDKFYVLDNKKGTGLFVRVREKLIIDRDMIISFCSSHMIIQVEPDKNSVKNDDKIVKVKFIQGPYQNKEKSFSSKDKTQVRIGRSKEAEILYKDDSVSRIQCTLSFENGEWVLYDGSLENGGNKTSTNGLWILASQRIEIIEKMILKSGNTNIIIDSILSEGH